MKKQRRIHLPRVFSRYYPWLLLSPTVIILLVLSIPLLIYSLYNSLLDYNFLHPERGIHFIGLKNYASIFSQPFFWYNTMYITLIFLLATVGIEFCLGFLLAYLANREIKGVNIFKLILITPLFVAPVSIGLIWKLMFNPSMGLINYLLWELRLPICNWISDASTALFSIVLVDIWQWTPFMFLILLAGFTSVPREPVEAAMIDGASGWRILRRIYIPYLKPIILVALLIRGMDALREFDKIYILTEGGPGVVTETLVYHAFRYAFRFFEMGYSTAISYIALIFVNILATILLQRIK